MSGPYRDVEIIKQIMRILEKTVNELTDLLAELKLEDEGEEAYRVTLKDRVKNQ